MLSLTDTAGEFVALPPSLGITPGARVTLALASETPPLDGLWLEGVLLTRGSGLAVYSCGGILVRTRCTDAPRARFVVSECGAHADVPARTL